jgi:dTDP-4-amino-4,6-dideoxygalactose transaminase
LFLALRAANIGAGDEVVVPSLTFPATVHVVRHVGAEPVLADIEMQSFGLDASEVAALVGPRTRGILGVDYAGQPSHWTELLDIARTHGLFSIEDAAHAFGAKLEGKRVGSYADATAFSFYATKCITTGEGGMLTCADESLAARVRLLSYHGMQRDAWKRHSDQGSWYYEIELPGYKCNMTDIQAALGLSQLQRAESLREQRSRVAQAYGEAFAGMEALILPTDRPAVEHAWHLYVVQLREEALRVGRNHFARALRAEGIVPSVHFIPYHQQPAGRDLSLRRPLPRTERFASRCLSLPLYPSMPDSEFQDVVEAVKKLVRYYAR